MKDYDQLPLHARINLRGNLKALQFKNLYTIAGSICGKEYLDNFVGKHLQPVWF